MGREDPQLKLRLTEALKARVTAAAQANGRSVNAEIVSALESAYPDPEQIRQELEFVDVIDEIQSRLDRLRMSRARELMDQTDRAIERANRLLKKPEED